MQRLKEMRTLKGKSQEDVANDLNISRQSYGLYEIGKREPSNEMLMKLADYFGVSTDYLLGRTDNPLEILGLKDVPSDFISDLRNADSKTIYELWNYLRFLILKKDGGLDRDISSK